jgi:hypothetical protein
MSQQKLQANSQWQYAKKGDVHTDLLPTWTAIRNENQWQRDADSFHVSLYSGAGEELSLSRQSKRGYQYGPNTLPYNLCRSAVDTLVAKISKHRPLPQVLTQKGNWSQQQRAKKATFFLEGQFENSKIFKKHGKRIVRDAAIFGRAFLYVWHDEKNIIVERTYPWEVFTDPWDAYYGEPRRIYRFRSMDRAVAIRRWPGKKAMLKDAARLDVAGDAPSDSWSNVQMVDRIDIIEAWSLRSGEDEKDGRYVAVCSEGDLEDSEWDEDFFPFAKLFYNDPVTGDLGTGLVEQLEGYQHDINTSSTGISEAFQKLGTSIITVPDNAGIHHTEFKNGVGYLLYHKPGASPSVFQPNPVNPMVAQRPMTLFNDGLNDAGISALSARSEKPAGVVSGIAIQTLDDVETERFIVFGRSYETFCIDVAQLMICANRSIAEKYGEFAVSVPMQDGKGLMPLKWADVDVDGFFLRVFPTSLLPQQLGARLEKLKMLWETELIDRSTFLRQLDAPDLQSELDLETADKLLIDEQLEYLAESPEETNVSFVVPSPYSDLQWALKRSSQRINRLQLDGAPDYVMRRITSYNDAVAMMLDGDEPDQPPPEGAPVEQPAPPMDGAMPPMPPEDMGAPMPAGPPVGSA